MIRAICITVGDFSRNPAEWLCGIFPGALASVGNQGEVAYHEGAACHQVSARLECHPNHIEAVVLSRAIGIAEDKQAGAEQKHGEIEHRHLRLRRHPTGTVVLHRCYRRLCSNDRSES
jgi:hypothetical protein